MYAKELEPVREIVTKSWISIKSDVGYTML